MYHQVRARRYALLVTGILVALILAPFVHWVASADENTPPAQDNPPNTLFVPVIFTTPQIEQNPRAIEIVAAQQGIPAEQLKVVSKAAASYPLQEISTTDYKVQDVESGATFLVVLGADNQALDTAVLEANEQARSLARYGKLEPELAEALAANQLEAATRVIVWLKEAPFERVARPDPAAEALPEDAAYFAEVSAVRQAAVAQVTGPVVQRFAQLGYAATADPLAPVVYAELPAAAFEAVQNWAEVDHIYLDRINQTELNYARYVINADIVNSRGITGSNQRVGEVEVGGRIATSNPYLAGVTNDLTYTCSTPSSHSTAVAGMIRSTHPTYRGIAPSALLWVGGSCTGSTSELQNRAVAAMNWGARSINLSWGANIGLVPGVNDRYFDNLVLNYYRTVVKSAGNEGLATGNITSPGLAYNLIAVGNFDDRNTTSYTDDLMSASSSWKDPTSLHNDREKPEVAGPGTNIISTLTVSPWVGSTGSGTSYAAPMVTGTTALLFQRAPSLIYWPEAVKAILMTTAVHNIEGVTRLSEKDGAGGIYADRADDVARGLNGTWGAINYSCKSPNPLTLTSSMYLVAGTRTRAAIAWDNDPAYASYATRPSADIDLRIINPSGAVVAYSISYDNTYEIVDFYPTVTGNFKLQVNLISCAYNPQYLAWAWKRGN